MIQHSSRIHTNSLVLIDSLKYYARTFVGDTAIMALGDSVEAATAKLQRAFDKVNNFTRKWLIKLMKPSRYMWTLPTKDIKIYR